MLLSIIAIFVGLAVADSTDMMVYYLFPTPLPVVKAILLLS